MALGSAAPVNGAPAARLPLRAAPMSAASAALLAACLAVATNLLHWRGADSPNYLFRIGRFRQVGFAVWNSAWYGGHHTLTYSALLPPLGALIGPSAVGVASAVIAAIAFERLVTGGLGGLRGRRPGGAPPFSPPAGAHPAPGRPPPPPPA